MCRIPRGNNIAIKIDVEGLEEDVILYGKNSLIKRKEVKNIYVEILNDNISKIDSILHEFGFECMRHKPKKK